MKIRTDFVTNSSSSSFLVFDVKHPKLFDFLKSIGVHIDSKDKSFTESITVKLDSGEELELWMDEADWMPACSDATSITNWIMTVILSEVESLVPAKDLDEYSEFTMRLLEVLNEKGLLHMNLENEDEIDREILIEQLGEHFDKMDKDIKSATIEFNTGFEGEILNMEYIVLKNGYKLTVAEHEFAEEHLECLSGIVFALVGDEDTFEDKKMLVELLEKLGATVVNEFSDNVDCVVCNKLNKNKEIIKKTDNLCIPVISEKGLHYRYANCGGDIEMLDDIDVYGEIFECTYEGGFYNMFYEYGIGIVERSTPNGDLKRW